MSSCSSVSELKLRKETAKFDNVVFKEDAQIPEPRKGKCKPDSGWNSNRFLMPVMMYFTAPPEVVTIIRWLINESDGGLVTLNLSSILLSELSRNTVKYLIEFDEPSTYLEDVSAERASRFVRRCEPFIQAVA